MSAGASLRIDTFKFIFPNLLSLKVPLDKAPACLNKFCTDFHILNCASERRQFTLMPKTKKTNKLGGLAHTMLAFEYFRQQRSDAASEAGRFQTGARAGGPIM
jgi:hypothetical protein